MKKLNTHEFYRLGQALNPLVQFDAEEDDLTLGDIMFIGFRARRALLRHIGEGGIFSPSSRRAANALLRAMERVAIPKELDGLSKVDAKEKLAPWGAQFVVQAARDFETVLANDLPGLAIYYVSPKGIYSTDGLISHAEEHLPEKIRDDVPQQAKVDINEAGRCLAFELPTASAFHMWRAVETLMGTYYENLTGHTFEQDNIQRNWGRYVEVLENVGADKKISTFLDHIRSEYRNPVSHPSVNVELDEAFNLFSTALSVIGQIARTIQSRAAPSP